MTEEYITGAEALMRSLERQGVDTLFGYPGGSIIPVFDALYDHRDKLRHVLVRHEQGAAHAAQGYARVSGKVGVGHQQNRHVGGSQLREAAPLDHDLRVRA